MSRDSDSESNMAYTVVSTGETIEYYTVDSMIEKAGGFGRIQIAILVCMLVTNIPTAFYAHGLPVLEQFPQYICTTTYGFDYR